MNNKKIVAGITSFLLTASCCIGNVPYSCLNLSEKAMTVNAVDNLKTRDIWFADADVNRWESEHFQFIWGKNGADSSKITPEFLKENAQHLEACWDVYMNELHMEAPTQSVNLDLRDGNEYKVNFYLSGTGLSRFEDDWAYMGYDDEGYAFMFCCTGAMQNSPNPSWVLPHEFGHVVTAHQRGWNSNKYVSAWWEAIANWYREQFLYSDYYSKWADVSGITDYFETYMKNLWFTPILGRDNYASWFFLQYITENPDNLSGYGSSFVKDLMQQGQYDEYPYLEIERLSGADIKDTLGHYAKRLATLDLAHKKDYQARQNQLLARGEWNWSEIFTILEKSAKSDNYYVVPTERAPQQFGVNIIPLNATGNEISIKLDGLTNVSGADWRACIVIEQRDGNTRYSDLFKAGETASIKFDSNTDSQAYLTVTATPDSDTWQFIGVPWAYGEGEFDENNYPHLSKTRYPYAVTINGAEIRQSQNDSAYEDGHIHPNGGGFVSSTANVSDSVYVGKNAKVLGYATVTDNAVIDGYAVVTGSANVSGNAVVNGHAVVAERASVKDNAIISDNAGVMGSAVISGNARVIESGLVYDNYSVSGNATVKGTAFCMVNGSATGQAMPDGDYYDDSSRTVQAGSVFGWASPDKYVNNRPYNDGQYAGLEFNSDSSFTATDSFTSTFGVSVGNPEWSSEKTSGKGVMTFDGKNQYLIADSSYVALHDADYQTAVLIRDNKKNTVFRFGDDDKYMSLTAENGDFTFEISNGKDVQTVKAESSYTAGTWATVSVILKDDTANLVINNGNGAKKFTGNVTIDPVDIMSDNAKYLIADEMNGSIDFFRVNFKEVSEPEYYYTEKEDILSSEPSGQVLVGDVLADMSVDVFDMVKMRKILLDSGTASKSEKAAADTNGDGVISVADAVLLQNYLLGKITEFPAGTIAEY